MVGCYTFVGPTFLIESENFSVAFLRGAKHKHPNKCFVAFQDEKKLNHCWIINVYVPKTEFFLFFFSLVWKNFITPSLLSSSVFISKPSISETRHDRVSRSFHPKYSKNLSNYNVSYPQTCCRTKIKLTLAVTNRKCRRNWFKTTQNGQQNNPLGVAKKGGLETKFEETAGQMTVGHIRSYKFVRLGLKGLTIPSCN